MKRYRVEGGAAQIGPDETIGLTKQQFEPRAHRLITDGDPPENGPIVCSPKDGPIEFKAGEEIFLAAAPSKAMARFLTPVGHDDGVKRPPKEEPKSGESNKKAATAAKKPGGRASQPSDPAA